MSERQLQYCKFVVDEKPYCFWDWDLQDRSLTFLNGIDPEYFAYLAATHADALRGEQQQHAALAIRASYAQALETLFAFLGAAVQAPFCVPAWLVKYSNSDLDSLVGKINNRRPIYSSSGYKVITWEHVSQLVHTHLILEDKGKEKLIKDEFGKLWSRFASDFTNDKASREYNSIKHGFRAKPGGFFLALGIEEQPGVPTPADKMHLLGKSDFGSSFLIPENVIEAKDGKHHFRLKRYSLNWNPEDMLYGLRLIATSMNNIINYLKIISGTEADQVNFHWLSDSSLYREPWARSRTIGISEMSGFEYQISEDQIERFSKEEILKLYRSEKPENQA